MKRILLICTLAIVSIGTVIAQSADAKLTFISKASEFEGGTSRNRPDLYQTAYATLDGMMQQEITHNKSSLQQLSGKDKQTMQAKIKSQEQYYGEIKTLSADMVKNRVSIKTKLDAFQQTL